ncbi:MAG: hypothetical protein U1E23_02195 [Reyranellaceae bacterium]
MVDADLTPVLEMLRRLQDDMRDVKDCQRELLRRVGAMEQHIATMLGSIAGGAARIDRLTARVERIERRLDLHGQP